MLADDTNIIFSNNCYDTLYNLASKELVNINDWLIANKLLLNVSKTKHILFRTANSKPPHNKMKLRITCRKSVKLAFWT